MSKHEVVHLPNGQSLNVSRVFGGLFFESNDNNIHKSAFPAGWTIVLSSDINDADRNRAEVSKDAIGQDLPKVYPTSRYQHPTLQSDSLFISSISNPSIIDYKPVVSPTRATAMMLWATLYWYFQQEEPSPLLSTDASKDTPEAGKPRGEWRINIRREGIFGGRTLCQKLERMGIVASEESYVGVNPDASQDGWDELFVSRRAFWQLSPKLFLFTLTPTSEGLQRGRSSSSNRQGDVQSSAAESHNKRAASIGPFTSGSHLPTYFPPAPLQYTKTDGIRHPVRPKPPRQGETFYVRYIKSIGEWLSFRVASISDEPVVYDGPATDVERGDNVGRSDLQLLNKWMNEPRVAAFWGCSGPQEKQSAFLRANLESRHSMPVIGCWNGNPFGYFEVYWVKEDILAKHLNSWEVDDYDRGIHVLVGEQKYRGIHRLRCWISALAHYALLQDYRTNNLVLEPRVDNVRFIEHLEACGFQKEKEVTFPHKQSAFVRLRREAFEGPAI